MTTHETDKSDISENESSHADHAQKNHRINRTHRFLTVILWVGISFGITVIIAVIFGIGASAIYAKQYESKILPNIKIGEQNVGGLSVAEATNIIEKQIATIENNGIEITTENDETFLIPSVVTPLDSAGEDITVFNIDASNAIEQAYAYGHTGSFLQRWIDTFRTWSTKPTIYAQATIQNDVLLDLLDEQLTPLETEPTHAIMTVQDGQTIEIIAEKNGLLFNRDLIIQQLSKQLSSLSSTSFSISLQDTAPAVTKALILSHEEDVMTILQHAPLVIQYNDRSWEFDSNTVGSWLRYTEYGIHIDANALHESLLTQATDVEVDPIEGKWKLITDENNTPKSLEQITEPKTGKQFDVETAAKDALDVLQRENEPSITISLIESEPKFSPDLTGSQLPIKELLGTGHSNMTGSPANRQQNIRRGAEILNGTIIPQGAEFSLVSTLKPFTLENGYKAELVIKGNETTPEIGGGLCQVGTTTFRATMLSGLPVTSRANHSYAVSYYSDDRNGLPGTDATIYDPAPDFKFKNDTPGPILVQTRVEGNDLYFDFWGTSDGRKGDFSEPTISGWIQPPPTKIIETDTLAPGVRKCTETAHPGTTASFTYTVTQPDGTKTERVFTSKYKPWQAVCLEGKQPEPKPEEEKKETTKPSNSNTNTSTNSNKNTNTSTKTNSNKNTSTNNE